MKFEDLDIPAQVLEGIKAAGFKECTPVQAQTLPDALNGKDIAGQAQTGTGKTAAFLIAVFSRMLRIPPPGKGPSPRALIIAPTRELASQITAEADILGKAAGFRTISVIGGIDYKKQRDEILKGVDILIGTPGRLIDYLKQKVYSLRKTQFLVIDEADRMFDMGFISDLRFMLRRMSPYNKRQSMLFSATLSNRVLELCYEHMNMPERYTVTPEQVTVEKIEQEMYHVGLSEKAGLLLGILKGAPGGRFLIFCNMKSSAERLSRTLKANGFTAAALTGDLDQKKRIRVLSRFKKGELAVLIATDVASRGIHIDEVSHVINYDLPQDREDYVHRIGRTARAGASGKAISLACEDYVHSLPDIEEYIKQKIPVLPLTDDMIVTDYRKGPPKKSRSEGFSAGSSRKAGSRRSGPPGRSSGKGGGKGQAKGMKKRGFRPRKST